MEKSRKPAVCVIMPAYNAERFLEEAVRSVMAQTLTDWELLILDDCSTDGTAALAERLAAEDDRITVLRNEQNMGVAKTRNKGLDLCAGNYVALLDSDDIWLPEKLERQLEMAKKTGAALVYCSYGIMDDHGKKCCEDFFVPEQTDFEQSLIQSVLSCSTALLSPSVTEKYRFRTDLYHEDLELWLRILRDNNHACGVTDVLAKYRVMSGSRASNKLKCAMHRWPIYRYAMGFSAAKSMYLLVQYGILGLKKYSKQAGDTADNE